VRLRLQTQLLIVMLAVLSALTITSLLVVRHSVQSEVRRQTMEAVSSSVRAFDRLQKQQYSNLLRTASMVAELPTFKAIMATNHPATIQDASADFWKLSEADLLILADRKGRPMAVHASSSFSFDSAVTLLRTLPLEDSESWWQENSRLYRIASRQIIAGSGDDRQALGTLVLGLQIDDGVAHAIGRSTGSDVVLCAGPTVLASTFPEADKPELVATLKRLSLVDSAPRPIQVGRRHYEIGLVDLETGSRTDVRGYMLISLDSTFAFLTRLNATVLTLAVVVAVLGGILLRLISSAITRPLDNLISAVRALAAGNTNHSLDNKGSVEVAELASAFVSMRKQLTESQRRQLEDERLAALGRAAGSISHDLRHHLAALLANAEFLHDASAPADRADLYREIQRASEQMTMLIDSLVEISRERRTLALAEGDLAQIVGRSAEAVKANPDYRNQEITIRSSGDTRGVFDGTKLRRAFFNLLLNACEVVSPNGGRVEVGISATEESFECRVSDNGPGIPEEVRGSLFEPFISFGKNNGTGLGLTIASKIVRDHDGRLEVETTSASGTTFLIRLPRKVSPQQMHAAETTA
jgi:signal transduction histidine kinase